LTTDHCWTKRAARQAAVVVVEKVRRWVRLRVAVVVLVVEKVHLEVATHGNQEGDC
jgi:hypothetical protein